MISRGTRSPATRAFVLLAELAAILILPLAAAVYLMHVYRWDFSIPFFYDGLDSVWQLTLTKGLLDNGWILNNPYMGAPSVARWYNNAASQTSAVHSVFMLAIGRFITGAVKVQQYYTMLNFSLITGTAYLAGRALGVRRLLAFVFGMLFAFLPYRFAGIYYAFIPNYFVVPLAVLPPVWILCGRFAGPWARRDDEGALAAWVRRLTSRHFVASVPIVMLAAVSDGYYAFFALLLLGFAVAVRAVGGDIRRPAALVQPVLLVALLGGTALLLATPLRDYRRTHADEFSTNGVLDTTLYNKPFEAEIYTTSLKLLLAPSTGHRVPAMAAIGKEAIRSSNEGRTLLVGQYAPLGVLGGILFLVMLAGVFVRVARIRTGIPVDPDGAEDRAAVGAMSALSLFVLLCSIFGGIGTIIAFVYPTIRAYERFPVYLSALLYLSAGLVLTRLARSWGRGGQVALVAGVIVVGGAALLDQVPGDPVGGRDAEQARFRDDRAFVQSVEAAVPKSTMIYQYPYSNYLTDNRYYGWGSFQHMRLYVHSKALRWSNGASKNSPPDRWHTRLSLLPTEQLLTEVQAAGFGGVLVDRGFLPKEEYAELRAALVARTGIEPMEAASGRLAFWTLPAFPYRVEYDTDTMAPRRVAVSDAAALAQARLSRVVSRARLTQAVAAAGPGPTVVDGAADPALFLDPSRLDRGLGLAPVSLADLHADVACPDLRGPLSVSRDELTVTLRNRSEFDWQLNAGPYQLRVGLMKLLNADGSLRRWDGGFRITGRTFLPQGASTELRVPLAGLKLDLPANNPGAATTAVFSLVQDGVVWFGAADGNGECHVQLVP